MCFTCDELNDCLAPLYAQVAALEAALAAAQTTINNIQSVTNNITQQIQSATTVQAPTPVSQLCENQCEIYSGAKALVRYMNDTVVDLFELAEASPPGDNLEEFDLIIGAIPIFETLPLDELFGVVDWMFENQQQDYAAAYTSAFVDAAACRLFCLISANQCTLTADLLAEWLSGLDTDIPNNKASEIFSRFGDATGSGLTQQLGAIINDLRGGESIAHYFDRLLVEYEAGMQNCDPGYALCACAEFPTPVLSLAEDWNCGVIGATCVGSITPVTGMPGYWDIETAQCEGAARMWIKASDGMDFKYEFVAVTSGGAMQSITVDNAGQCHFSQSGVWIDEHQFLSNMVASRQEQTNSTWRLRIYRD